MYLLPAELVQDRVIVEIMQPVGKVSVSLSDEGAAT